MNSITRIWGSCWACICDSILVCARIKTDHGDLNIQLETMYIYAHDGFAIGFQRLSWAQITYALGFLENSSWIKFMAYEFSIWGSSWACIFESASVCAWIKLIMDIRVLYNKHIHTMGERLESNVFREPKPFMFWVSWRAQVELNSWRIKSVYDVVLELAFSNQLLCVHELNWSWILEYCIINIFTRWVSVWNPMYFVSINHLCFVFLQNSCRIKFMAHCITQWAEYEVVLELAFANQFLCVHEFKLIM